MKLSATAVFGAMALGLCACDTTPPPEVGYYGDTLTLGQVIEHVNENN